MENNWRDSKKKLDKEYLKTLKKIEDYLIYHDLDDFLREEVLSDILEIF